MKWDESDGHETVVFHRFVILSFLNPFLGFNAFVPVAGRWT